MYDEIHHTKQGKIFSGLLRRLFRWATHRKLGDKNPIEFLHPRTHDADELTVLHRFQNKLRRPDRPIAHNRPQYFYKDKIIAILGTYVDIACQDTDVETKRLLKEAVLNLLAEVC